MFMTLVHLTVHVYSVHVHVHTVYFALHVHVHTVYFALHVHVLTSCILLVIIPSLGYEAVSSG